MLICKRSFSCLINVVHVIFLTRDQIRFRFLLLYHGLCCDNGSIKLVNCYRKRIRQEGKHWWNLQNTRRLHFRSKKRTRSKIKIKSPQIKSFILNYVISIHEIINNIGTRNRQKKNTSELSTEDIIAIFREWTNGNDGDNNDILPTHKQQNMRDETKIAHLKSILCKKLPTSNQTTLS